MRAFDFMNRPVWTLAATDSVDQAVALLSGHRITAAPVLDGAGRLIGMVSEGDLLRAHAAGSAASVADVMTRTVIALPADAEISAVAAAMLEHNVHSVPIVDEDGEVEGMLCRHDLLRAYVRTDDRILIDVQDRLDQYAGAGRCWRVAVANGVVTISGHYEDEVERTVVGALAHTVTGVTRVDQTTQPPP